MMQVMRKGEGAVYAPLFMCSLATLFMCSLATLFMCPLATLFMCPLDRRFSPHSKELRF